MELGVWALDRTMGVGLWDFLWSVASGGGGRASHSMFSSWHELLCSPQQFQHPGQQSLLTPYPQETEKESQGTNVLHWHRGRPSGNWDFPLELRGYCPPPLTSEPVEGVMGHPPVSPLPPC